MNLWPILMAYLLGVVGLVVTYRIHDTVGVWMSVVVLLLAVVLTVLWVGLGWWWR